MILDEIRYRLRRSRSQHRQAWLMAYVVLFANLGALAIIAAYNAGWVE